jgi:predicted enzyme related to lactoylglutathione lyase
VTGATERGDGEHAPTVLFGAVGEFRVVVPSACFDESVRFYGEQLGRPVTKEFPGGRIFGFGDQARVEILDEQDAPPSSTVCAMAVDDVDELASSLRAAGVEIVDGPVDQPWGHRNLAVVDPNGVRLVFFHEIGPSR